MTEAEAKDSEEEAEGVATKQCGKEATSPHQIQITKPEVSRNLLDSSACKGLLNVGNGNDKISVTGKETKSDQSPNLHKIDIKHHEVLGSHDIGTLKDVTLGEQSKQYDRKGTPVRVGNDLLSTSTSAKRSPHSDAAKIGSISYLRKTPRRTTPPVPSGERASNLCSSPMMNIGKYNVSEGFDISSFTIEQAKDRSDFSGVKTPSKGADVLREDDQSGTLPEKRKMDVSSRSSKLQKTSHNPKASISEGSLVANRSGMFEPAPEINGCVEINYQLSPGNDSRYLIETAALNPARTSPANISTRMSASFDRKSPTLATPISKTSTSEIREDDNVEEELQTHLLGSEKANATSKFDSADACMSSAKDAIGDACEPENKMQDVGVSSPTTKRSETHKSNSPANLDLLKEGSVEGHSKPVRTKMLAKKCLGSKKRLGKRTTVNQKGSIYLNNTTSQNDTVTCSIGGKETDDYDFVNSEKLVTNVVTVMEAETKDALQSGNEVENKSEFMDDETEAPEDKEENECEVAVEEKHAEIVPEEKIEDVQRITNNSDGSMAGMHEHTVASDNETDQSEQKTADCGKKSEVGEPTHVKNASKEKITKGTKCPSGETKEKIVPSATKITNSNKAANEEDISERNNEKIQGKKKESLPHLGGKTKGTKSVNKLQNTLESGKENRPIDSGDTTVSRGKKGVEKVTSSKAPSKIDSKADESDLEAKIVECVLRTDPVWFILSGHKLQRKEFQQVIRRLKGRVCRDSHHWSYQATHFIVPDPIRRTEKFFAAAASGRWILKTDYLTDSNQAGRFLAEEPYEWNKNGLNEDGAINLEAPRKWRLLRERTGHGAFHGMRIIIYGDCIAPPLDTLKRVVKAGDGTILATSPPYSRFLESGVDFAIVSPGMPRVDMWVQEFLTHEIPCVVADYLVEYVCKPGYPLERHVQYNTHAWAEKSFKNLANRLEIVEEATPQKDCGDEDTPCQVCGSRDRGEVMLICSDESGSAGCGVGTHIDCCDPPLECVPEEDWFCPKCSVVKNSKNHQKNTRKGTSVSRRK